MRVNTRHFERFRCDEMICVSWEDPLGQVKYSSAKCLGVSERGISLELVEPVEPRSYVSVKSEKLKLAGTAAVRFCKRKAGKYNVGLEFTAGLKCPPALIGRLSVA